ncbi:hypothetical protein AC07_3719 [Escherichia coli 3-475-03_S3_C1]|nr:hypothetical protein EC179100_2378 [Escherichia coli 179100]KEK75617.1 hypothetical protein AC07_3719 [Escherichia coli 3-475-03_S3_C1]
MIFCLLALIFCYQTYSPSEEYKAAKHYISYVLSIIFINNIHNKNSINMKHL